MCGAPEQVRARTFYADKAGIDVADVEVPVVGRPCRRATRSGTAQYGISYPLPLQRA